MWLHSAPVGLNFLRHHFRNTHYSQLCSVRRCLMQKLALQIEFLTLPRSICTSLHLQLLCQRTTTAPSYEQSRLFRCKATNCTNLGGRINSTHIRVTYIRRCDTLRQRRRRRHWVETKTHTPAPIHGIHDTLSEETTTTRRRLGHRIAPNMFNYHTFHDSGTIRGWQSLHVNHNHPLLTILVLKTDKWWLILLSTGITHL